MTTYETTATPIRTIADLDAAVAAEAHLEFTVCRALVNDDTELYAAPSGAWGWIPTTRGLARDRIRAGHGDDGTRAWRAFYPAAAEPFVGLAEPLIIIDDETPDERIAADWAAPSLSEAEEAELEAAAEANAGTLAPDYETLVGVAPDDATIGADPYAGEAFAKLSPGPAEPPRFRITVTIEADTQEGYQDALATLAEGVL